MSGEGQIFIESDTQVFDCGARSDYASVEGKAEVSVEGNLIFLVQ